MQLPVMPPVKPMLAKPVKGVPEADSVDGGLLFEPKWGGFRSSGPEERQEGTNGTRAPGRWAGALGRRA
jgi:ATP-dependent DNA ligase